MLPVGWVKGILTKHLTILVCVSTLKLQTSVIYYKLVQLFSENCRGDIKKRNKVRRRRFELPRPLGHYPLKVARLPVSPPSQLGLSGKNTFFFIDLKK